jgi:hypothetical protein
MIMAEEKKAPRKNLHTSYKGSFKADSLEVGKNQNGTECATATFVLNGKSEKEVVVKGYNKHIDTLKAAVEAGGEQILRGQLLSDKEGVHMSIYATGPEMVTGRLHNVRTSVGTEGKEPFTVGYFVHEKPEEGNRRPSSEIRAYGDDAVALAEATEDHIVTIAARGGFSAKTDKDGNAVTNENGKQVFDQIMLAEGAPELTLSPREKEKTDAPEM